MHHTRPRCEETTSGPGPRAGGGGAYQRAARSQEEQKASQRHQQGRSNERIRDGSLWPSVISLVCFGPLCETIHMITIAVPSRQSVAVFLPPSCNAGQGGVLLSSRPSWKPPGCSSLSPSSLTGAFASRWSAVAGSRKTTSPLSKNIP